MVHFNANVDLKTLPKVNTHDLNQSLGDICDRPLYITLVAREEAFKTEAWQDNQDSFLRIVLPYKEVLESENTSSLIIRSIMESLEKINWLDIKSIKRKIRSKLSKTV